MTTEPTPEADGLETLLCYFGPPVLLLFPALHFFLPQIFWYGPGQNLFHLFLYLAELAAPAIIGFFLFILACAVPQRHAFMKVFYILSVVGLIFFSYKYGLAVTLKDQKRVEQRVADRLAPTQAVIDAICARFEGQPLGTTSGSIPANTPYVILMSKKLNEKNRSFTGLKVRGNWPRTLLSRKEYKNLYAAQDADIGAAKTYAVPYVYIVGYGAEFTGRQVSLDLGKVPEMRKYAKVFAVDAASGALIFESDKIMGGKARKPLPSAGTGVRYLSVRMGGRPNWHRIEKTIRRHQQGKL